MENPAPADIYGDIYGGIMSVQCLQVDSACTNIRLSQTTDDTAPLVEQVAPYLARNKCLVIDAEEIYFSHGNWRIGEYD